jgi:hypothetical protein
MKPISVVQIKKYACSTHKRESSYDKYIAQAEQKKLKGEKQTQCKVCGRWYFDDEF